MNDLELDDFGISPRVTRSAGFLSPGQNRQNSAFVLDRLNSVRHEHLPVMAGSSDQAEGYHSL